MRNTRTRPDIHPIMRFISAFVALAIPFCLSTNAHAEPPDLLTRFAAANNKEQAAYCVLAIGLKVTDLSKAATEHGGLDAAAAESAWEKIDMYEMRGELLYRLLHLQGDAGAAVAEKAATDTYVAAVLADEAKAREQQYTVADRCAVDAFNAMAAQDARVKYMEAGFRDTFKHARAEAKADFIRKATTAYHD